MNQSTKDLIKRFNVSSAKEAYMQVVKEAAENNVPVSLVADKYGISVINVYSGVNCKSVKKQTALKNRIANVPDSSIVNKSIVKQRSKNVRGESQHVKEVNKKISDYLFNNSEEIKAKRYSKRYMAEKIGVSIYQLDKAINTVDMINAFFKHVVKTEQRVNKIYSYEYKQKVVDFLIQVEGNIIAAEKEFNLSPTTLYTWFKKYAPTEYDMYISKIKNRSNLTTEQKEDMYNQFFVLDKSLKEISQQYNLSVSQVRNAVYQVNLYIKGYNDGFIDCETGTSDRKCFDV